VVTIQGQKHRRKAKSMHNAKRILIAIDDSDASYRAVTYVGSIIGGREDFRVCLLHALPPLPRELLEFGGASDPQQEEQAEACIHAEQARWLEAVVQAAEPVFTRAKGILHEAHVPADAVETQIVDTVNTQDTVLDILEAARAQQWGTVVVGRESFHGLKALLTSHVGDTLIRQAQGLTVWVVE
jgi:nucleotide-binding universal stress UspA family protein